MDSQFHNNITGSLTLRSLDCSVTYGGAEACSFSEELAERLIQGELSGLRRPDCPAYCAPSPNSTRLDYFTDPKALEVLRVLPYWKCSVWLPSPWYGNEPPEDAYEWGSQIQLLWFQDQFPLPGSLDGITSMLHIEFRRSSEIDLCVAPHAREWIETADWRLVAGKYSYGF